MDPPLSAIVARARRGDGRAIAYLLTQSLRSQGIVARGHWQNRTLLLDLEAEGAIDPAQAVFHIRRGLKRLGLATPLAAVQVRGRQRGQSQWAWQDSFEVTATAATTAPELEEWSDRRPPERPPLGRQPEEPEPEEPEPADPAPEDPEPEDPAPSSPGSASALPVTTPPEATADEASTYPSDSALAALAHLAPLVSYLVVGSQWLGGWPLFWGGSFLLPWRVVAPLALLLIHSPGQGNSPTQGQAKAALNFQLTMLIAWTVTIALMFILVGFLLVIPLALLEIICCVVAAVNATEGKPARYPAISFVR